MSFPIAPIVGQNQGKSNLPSFPKELADKLHARMSDKKTATNIMELRPELFKEVNLFHGGGLASQGQAKFGKNSGRVEFVYANKIREISKKVGETERESFVKDLDEAIEMISSKYQKDADINMKTE
uniref:Uncharacterized protein n=1 Tax=Ditylenchus dipsaci TaxID=166011 RepID=A0A915E953_9BILA